MTVLWVKLGPQEGNMLELGDAAYPDNSPGGQSPTIQVFVLMSDFIHGSGPSGELSWWGIVRGIVVPEGNEWLYFYLVGNCHQWGVVKIVSSFKSPWPSLKQMGQ